MNLGIIEYDEYDTAGKLSNKELNAYKKANPVNPATGKSWKSDELGRFFADEMSKENEARKQAVESGKYNPELWTDQFKKRYPGITAGTVKNYAYPLTEPMRILRSRDSKAYQSSSYGPEDLARAAREMADYDDRVKAYRTKAVSPKSIYGRVYGEPYSDPVAQAIINDKRREAENFLKEYNVYAGRGSVLRDADTAAIAKIFDAKPAAASSGSSASAGPAPRSSSPAAGTGFAVDSEQTADLMRQYEEALSSKAADTMKYLSNIDTDVSKDFPDFIWNELYGGEIAKKRIDRQNKRRQRKEDQREKDWEEELRARLEEAERVAKEDEKRAAEAEKRKESTLDKGRRAGFTPRGKASADPAADVYDSEGGLITDQTFLPGEKAIKGIDQWWYDTRIRNQDDRRRWEQERQKEATAKRIQTLISVLSDERNELDTLRQVFGTETPYEKTDEDKVSVKDTARFRGLDESVAAELGKAALTENERRELEALRKVLEDKQIEEATGELENIPKSKKRFVLINNLLNSLAGGAYGVANAFSQGGSKYDTNVGSYWKDWNSSKMATALKNRETVRQGLVTEQFNRYSRAFSIDDEQTNRLLTSLRNLGLDTQFRALSAEQQAVLSSIIANSTKDMSIDGMLMTDLLGKMSRGESWSAEDLAKFGMTSGGIEKISKQAETIGGGLWKTVKSLFGME